jgi:predicted nucleic acid-binding protein
MADTQNPWCLDSNIFLYAVDTADPRKKAIALALWQQSAFACNVLPAQVLGEVFDASRTRFQYSSESAHALVVELVNHHRVVPALEATFRMAVAENMGTQRQFWDCVTIATCAEHGVKTLYTENAAGQPQTVLGVQLVNPFA